MPDVIDPGTGGPTTQPNPAVPANLDPAVVAADRATQAAQAIANQAQADYTAASQAFDAIDPTQDITGEGRKAASTRVTDASRALADARGKLADAYTRTADATASAQARIGASRNQDPSLNNYYDSHAAQARAGADLARAQANVLSANSDADRKKALAEANLATANAQAVGILTPAQAAQANGAASESNARAANIAALTPAQVRQTNAAAAQTEAQTGQLIPSQVTLNQAQADEARSRAGLDDAQAAEIVGKTGPEIQDLVAQGHLNQAQADQIKGMLPLNQAATQAQTQKTQAETLAIQQGALVGINDQINVLRGQIAQGNLTPEEADQQIQDLLHARVMQATTGATQYQYGQTSLDAETTRRGQDEGLNAAKVSGIGSTYGGVLSSLAKMNDTVQPGSPVVGKAIAGLLMHYDDQLHGLNNPAMDTPLLQSMRGNAMPRQAPGAPAVQPGATNGVPPAAVPTPATTAAPTTTIAPDGTVTIQHTAQPATSAAPTSGPNLLNNPFSQSGQPEGSSRGNAPAFLQNPNPLAGADDVAQLWAGDPHFDPTSQSNALASTNGSY